MIDWTEFERLAGEHLKYLRAKGVVHPDVVEDLSINVESDEGNQRVYLTLEGDFVTTMLQYLSTTDSNDPNYNKFTVRLDTSSVEQLAQEIPSRDGQTGWYE